MNAKRLHLLLSPFVIIGNRQQTTGNSDYGINVTFATQINNENDHNGYPDIDEADAV